MLLFLASENPFSLLAFRLSPFFYQRIGARESQSSANIVLAGFSPSFLTSPISFAYKSCKNSFATFRFYVMFMHAAANAVDPPSFHFDFMRGLGGRGDAKDRIENMHTYSMRSKPKAQRPTIVVDPLGLAA